MRISYLALAAAAAFSLSACESPADKAAEERADAIEAQAEAEADALEQRADAIEEAGDEKADEIEQAAGQLD